MEERIIQFRVGVVVVASVCIGIILVLYFGEGWKPKYTLFLQTRMAPGVSKNTPVKKNGILIGRVWNVETKEDGVLLTLKIDEGEQIYSGDICEFQSSPLVGDTTLGFVQGEELGEPLSDGDAVMRVKPGTRPQDLMEMFVDLRGSIEQAFTQIGDAGEQIARTSEDIGAISRKLNAALGDDESEFRKFFSDLRSVAGQAESALSNFNSVMSNVNNLVGDEETQAKIKMTVQAFPDLVDNAQSTLTQTRETLQRFSSVGERADRNLANLESFTKALGENGDDFAKEIRQTLTKVNQLSGELEQFTQSLNDSQGTIGLLINDPELYYRFVGAAENVEEITLRLEPMMNDLRGFADKINRDPGVIVRGALDRRPNGAGVRGVFPGNPAYVD